MFFTLLLFISYLANNCHASATVSANGVYAAGRNGCSQFTADEWMKHFPQSSRRGNVYTPQDIQQGLRKVAGEVSAAFTLNSKALQASNELQVKLDNALQNFHITKEAKENLEKQLQESAAQVQTLTQQVKEQGISLGSKDTEWQEKLEQETQKVTQFQAQVGRVTEQLIQEKQSVTELQRQLKEQQELHKNAQEELQSKFAELQKLLTIQKGLNNDLKSKLERLEQKNKELSQDLKGANEKLAAQAKMMQDVNYATNTKQFDELNAKNALLENLTQQNMSLEHQLKIEKEMSKAQSENVTAIGKRIATLIESNNETKKEQENLKKWYNLRCEQLKAENESCLQAEQVKHQEQIEKLKNEQKAALEVAQIQALEDAQTEYEKRLKEQKQKDLFERNQMQTTFNSDLESARNNFKNTLELKQKEYGELSRRSKQEYLENLAKQEERLKRTHAQGLQDLEVAHKTVLDGDTEIINKLTKEVHNQVDEIGEKTTLIRQQKVKLEQYQKADEKRNFRFKVATILGGIFSCLALPHAALKYHGLSIGSVSQFVLGKVPQFANINLSQVPAAVRSWGAYWMNVLRHFGD